MISQRLYWPLLAAILGFALGGSVAWGILYTKPVAYQGPTEQTQHGSRTDTSAADQHRSPGPALAIVPQTPSENLSHEKGTDDNRTTTQPEKGWWDKLWTDPNATFAGAVALFTLALVVVGAIQARRLRQAVVATESSVTETRRIGEAQVRAYVDIREIGVVFIPWGGVPNTLDIVDVSPIVKIVARNTGQSPARNFVWNPAVQYFAIATQSNKNPEPQVGEVGANWRERLGAGISVGGDHTESMMVPEMALHRFLAERDTLMNVVILNVRIQFEFKDVFGDRIVDEAYFSGVFIRNTEVPPTKTEFGETQWSGKLSRIDKPRDWPAAKNQNQSQQDAADR